MYWLNKVGVSGEPLPRFIVPAIVGQVFEKKKFNDCVWFLIGLVGSTRSARLATAVWLRCIALRWWRATQGIYFHREYRQQEENEEQTLIWFVVMASVRSSEGDRLGTADVALGLYIRLAVARVSWRSQHLHDRAARHVDRFDASSLWDHVRVLWGAVVARRQCRRNGNRRARPRNWHRHRCILDLFVFV